MGSLALAELLEGGGLLHIAIGTPKGNILSRAMMGEIAAGLRQHREDRALRLVLLTALGENFSFGASVEEHRREQAPGMLAAFHDLIRTAAAYPVPVAALVQGHCLGGAFELVLACHLVFATPSARFACPEVKLGVFPPVLAAIGPLRLGQPVSERLLLTPFSAFAIRQATKASRRASGLLQALQTPLSQIERQYVEEVLESRDGNEGIAAFLERRKPVWRDC